jgi:hypothetical protein
VRLGVSFAVCGDVRGRRRFAGAGGGFSTYLAFGDREHGAKEYGIHNSQVKQAHQIPSSIAIVQRAKQWSNMQIIQPTVTALFSNLQFSHPIPRRPISIFQLSIQLHATLSIRPHHDVTPKSLALHQASRIHPNCAHFQARHRPTNSHLHVGPGQIGLRPKEGAADEPSRDAQPGTGACACAYACRLPHIVPALWCPAWDTWV